jgi:CDGSH-type Zn-finger protein/uncharacterized Fe-S cluster protein YjdI
MVVTSSDHSDAPSREQLVHSLYEAAELEHNLMCTYLYAAFSLRSGEAEGLLPDEALAVTNWRKTILRVAIEEMGHLTAVWNITAALGGAPRFGRGNFPLDPGMLPAGIVVKLAPFSEAALQHFTHLERPNASAEPDGAGFAPELVFTRGARMRNRLTPMADDYETVGAFYECLSADLRAFTAAHGEKLAFCGDPALQLSPTETGLAAAKPVICSKTALAAFTAIVEQGEGAPEQSTGSHFQRFLEIRDEFAQLKAKNPSFSPAFPAAHNPVLRRPMRAGRIWIEDEEAAATVDLANSTYAVMLRLIAHSYLLPRPQPEKTLAIDLGLGLMRAMTHLGERAARLPAGPSNPECHAGMSFTALRDAAALPPGASAWRFFDERMQLMAEAGEKLAARGDARAQSASRILTDLAKKSARALDRAVSHVTLPAPAPLIAATRPPSQVAPMNTPPEQGPTSAGVPAVPPTPTSVDGVDYIEGRGLTLVYEGKKCIHSRFCVTGAPNVFIANIKGPWIQPDAVTTEALVEIAHACPSGAIRYQRKDGKPDESPPPVNLISIREAGPYAFRGELEIDGKPGPFRATLCRCGASKNKPYCDGSHHDVQFSATGEPATTSQTDMLPVRNGTVSVDPLVDGPLQVRGNLEITSGTGRVVARLAQAKLCRCGASNTKPFCDGSHVRVGFKSTGPLP